MKAEANPGFSISIVTSSTFTFTEIAYSPWTFFYDRHTYRSPLSVLHISCQVPLYLCLSFCYPIPTYLNHIPLPFQATCTCFYWLCISFLFLSLRSRPCSSNLTGLQFALLDFLNKDGGFLCSKCP